MSSVNIFEFGDAELPTLDELVTPALEASPLREADAEDFDWGDDVPSAGTACAWCKALGNGHWCQAKRFWGQGRTPICAPCGDGEDCSVVASRSKGEEELLTRFDHSASPVRVIALADGVERVVIEARRRRLLDYEPSAAALQMAKREPARERYQPPAAHSVAKSVFEAVLDTGPAVPEKVGKVMGQRLTESQLQKIKDAPAGESASQIARRLGINMKACSHHLTRFRKARAKGLDAPLYLSIGRKPMSERGLAPKVAVSRPNAIDIVGVSERIHALATPAAPTIEGVAGEARISISSDRLDAWWGRLTPAKKAELAFAAVGL